jgi:hypothetical protein
MLRGGLSTDWLAAILRDAVRSGMAWRMSITQAKRIPLVDCARSATHILAHWLGAKQGHALRFGR